MLNMFLSPANDFNVEAVSLIYKKKKNYYVLFETVHCTVFTNIIVIPIRRYKCQYINCYFNPSGYQQYFPNPPMQQSIAISLRIDYRISTFIFYTI
jgi:hypothetical protein